MRIELEGVGVRLGTTRTLQDINLQWDGPGLFLVTGSSGAGKSLFLRLLAGLASSEGSMSREYQGCGYLPQLFSFYPNLTPIDFLDYLLLLEGITGRRQRARIIQVLIARADIDRQARLRIGSLPPSARQRIAIVQSLIGNPECLTWDEPEQNLKTSGQGWLQTIIEKEARERLLILASSNVQLYEQMAIRIAVLHDGRLVFEGSRAQLLASAEGQVWEGKIPFKQWQKYRLENLVTQADIVDGGISVRVLGQGQYEYPGFEPVPGTVTDAVELLIQANSLPGIRTRDSQGSDNLGPKGHNPTKRKGLWR